MPQHPFKLHKAITRVIHQVTVNYTVVTFDYCYILRSLTFLLALGVGNAPTMVGSRHQLTDCSVGLTACLESFVWQFHIRSLIPALLSLSLNLTVKFGADL